MWRAIACLLIVFGAFSAGVAAQTFHDDFASYPDSATGEPSWVTDSVAWEMRAGAFHCIGPGRSFAIYSGAPFANEQVVEATVVISGKTVDQWKIAGVMVSRDNRNFWHLALVESPDADGARHFAELVEAYDGGWLSESAPETKLTPIERRGTDFDWRYDHPYRLRLRLTPELIEGTVNELGGEVVSRIAYRLDNTRSVRAGYAGLDSGGFDSRFDDFHLEVMSTMSPPQTPAVPPPDVESWSGLRGLATGFFRVEERGGRWWLFDPRGRAFYIIGTDHANYNVHWCEALGYAPYHRNMVEKFGSEEAWATSTVARLRCWGFNTVAANHSPSLRHQGLAHIDFISFGQSFAASDDICPQVHWTGFPNVFSPKWKEHCRKQARQQCAPTKDDPWLIGYFLDNELEWFGKSYRPWGLADEAFKKPASHAAKTALIAFLRERYHDDIAAFNRAWGANLGSFDALLRRRKPIGDASDAARADKLAFVRIIAQRYFSACAEALREFDPNHLNLGCRFAGDAPPIWDLAGSYCDIVSVNCYRQADLERRTIIGFEENLRRWHQAARRPLMITEWSFPALDSGLPCQHGAGQRFDTQQQRAAAWRIFQELLFRTPYIVGSDYFMWVDEPALGISSTFPEDSNYGLVNERDEPYAELTETARRVNAMVYRFHAGRVAELRPVLSGHPPQLSLRNDGTADAETTVRVWIDGAQRDLTARVAAGAQVGLPLDLPASPGGHFVHCVIDPEGAVAEGDRSDNRIHAMWYVPGLPWAGMNADERRALVVANPTDENLMMALVRAPTSGQGADLQAWAPGAGWLACAHDAQGDAVTIIVPELAAHSAATVFLSAAVEGSARPAPSAEGGPLSVAPGREGEEAAAVLMMSGERVGRLAPLIWQRTPQDQWVGPRLESYVEQDLGAALEVRATLSRAGQGAKGVIGRHDQPGAPINAPRAFTCGYALTWVRGRPWFAARLLSLRSDDPRPWECPGYFHYLLPDFDAEAVEPGVPNYYRPFAGWWNKQRQVGIGALALAPDDFNIYFWKDEAGGLHPDARRDIDRRFSKGTLFDAPQPDIVIFAAQGESLREASLRISQQARAERMIETLLAPAERRGVTR